MTGAAFKVVNDVEPGLDGESVKQE